MTAAGFRKLALQLPEATEGEHFRVADKLFAPVPNAWGRKGATIVKLFAVKPNILKAALRSAWLRRAPKKLHP